MKTGVPLFACQSVTTKDEEQLEIYAAKYIKINIPIAAHYVDEDKRDTQKTQEQNRKYLKELGELKSKVIVHLQGCVAKRELPDNIFYAGVLAKIINEEVRIPNDDVSLKCNRKKQAGGVPDARVSPTYNELWCSLKPCTQNFLSRYRYIKTM